MIWIVILLLCVLVLFFVYMVLSNMNKRINEITKTLEEKTKICTELQYKEQEEMKKIKNLVNATNTLKRELDKIQTALTVFNNGFDGIQSTM